MEVKKQVFLNVNDLTLPQHQVPVEKVTVLWIQLHASVQEEDYSSPTVVHQNSCLQHVLDVVFNSEETKNLDLATRMELED